MRTFRVGTLNVWNRFGPWEQRLRTIRQGLRTLAPDVMGLEEVLRYEGFDQGELIAEGLGYHVAWGKASDGHGRPFGNAILSRWPIVRSEVVALPREGTSESRSLLYAELAAPFAPVPVFCTHLNWRLDHGHVRQVQVKAVVEAVARLAPAGTTFPPLVVGDFNAEPDADEIRFMRGLTGLGGPCVCFKDAFGVAGDGSLGATFSKNNPFAEVQREAERRIDYVFVRLSDDPSRGEPVNARVCFDQPYEGTYASDHYGVVTDVTVAR